MQPLLLCRSLSRLFFSAESRGLCLLLSFRFGHAPRFSLSFQARCFFFCLPACLLFTLRLLAGEACAFLLLKSLLLASSRFLLLSRLLFESLRLLSQTFCFHRGLALLQRRLINQRAGNRARVWIAQTLLTGDGSRRHTRLS